MSGQQEVCYLESGGLTRRYVLYRPDRVIIEGARVPVVMMLDGRGGTPWTAMRSTGWNAKADREGFAVLYPEATRLDPEGPLHFLTNPQMWNAGSGGSDAERPDVDDVTFLRDVLKDAMYRARIDPARCFMTGFSNGAAMTFRFALAFPRMLVGIAPVAGHLRVDHAMLHEPIPMIGLFGRLDPLSPWAGGAVDLPWGRREYRPPAEASADAWAALCGHEPAGRREEKEPGLSRIRYGAAGARDEVCFITVDDLGHTWPGGNRLLPESLIGPLSNRVKGTDVIWDFFAQREPA